jgi:hypothetical protein
VEAEDQLLEQGLLPGIDYCRHAVELSTRGRVPDAGHLLGCPVCLRRWRVTEAGIQGWQPMDHDQAIDGVTAMAELFATQERSGAYRGFYAHLASCTECERRLAELTFDASLPKPAEH